MQYAIIFPEWFPKLAARTELLQEVHSVVLEQRTIAGGQRMVVYRVLPDG